MSARRPVTRTSKRSRAARLRRGALLAACGAALCAAACGGSGAPDAGQAPAGSPGATGAPTAPAAPAPSAATVATAEALQAGPNLLLVTLDTLRADHVGAYGDSAAATPVLDRLAAEGIRFDQVASTAPLTLVAHGSIMTGEIPPHHGVRDNGDFLAEDSAATLAQVLQGSGYATGGFVGSFVLDRRFGIARGFESYTDFGASESDAGVELLLRVERRGDTVVDDALAWLGRQSGPWFAWVHLYDPHTPYDPPEPFATRFSSDPYAGEIAYADQQLGRLLRYLEESGRDHDTLVIVAADHGESLGDHGEEFHGFFIYDSTIHVPLIVRGDGLPAGMLVGGQASLADLLPTALALLGVEDPDAARRDGRDLRLLIADPSAAGAPAYAESFTPLLTFGWSELRALRGGGYKYIAAPRPELYDLRADPGEQHDRVDREPERAGLLAKTLSSMVAEDDPVAVAQGDVAADPETIERLRSLGYLGGSTSAAALRRDVDPKDEIGAYESFIQGFEAATNAVRAGEWDEAWSLLQELDRIAPDQFIIRHYLGQVALGRGDVAGAIDLLEQSLALSPSYYSPTYVELAKAYRRSGRGERAIELLEDVVELYPDNFALRFNLGYHLQAAGRLDEALDEYERAAELVPRYPQLLTNIASIHLARGEPQKALDALREALDADPDNGRAWGNVGMILGGSGRFEEAERAFRRATELLPDEAPLHFNLGLALMRQGKNQEAIAQMRRALQLDPQMEPARQALRALGGG